MKRELMNDLDTVLDVFDVDEIDIVKKFKSLSVKEQIECVLELTNLIDLRKE